MLYGKNDQDNEIKSFVRLYDVSVKESPLLIREVSVEGYYVSSRMIGEYVYVVARKGAWIVND